MSISHKASNLALHNRVCSIPEGGILFPFDDGLHGIDSAGNIIYPEEGAVATLRPNEGRFSGAVAVEEGTTNLFTNPKLLNNGQDWVQNSSTAWVDSSGEYPYIHGEAQYDGVYQTLSLSATTYTLTYLVKHKSGSNQIGSHFDGAPTMNVRVDGGGWINGNIIDVPSDGNWHLVEIKATYTTAGSYWVYLQPGRAVVGVSEFWFKYAQLEQKPFATSFVEGTRANGRLGYEQFPEGPFTVAVWGKTLDFRAVHRMPFGKWNRFYYSVDPSNKLLLSWIDSTSVQRTVSGSITIDPLDWHFYVLTWDGTTLIGYVDGDEHVRATPDMAQPGDTFGWGNISGTGSVSYPWNGLLDEGLILPYAATDEEIKAWYHSNAPMYNNADTYITL